MLLNGLILFSVTLGGIVLGCKVFGYDISIVRMLAAAGVFAGLNAVPIPIPLLGFLIPFIGLYIALMDDSLQRQQVNRVFAVTTVTAFLATLIVYRVLS